MRTKDLRNTLEHVEAHLEQEEEENSTRRGPEGTDKPKHNPAAQGDVNSCCKHYRDQQDECYASQQTYIKVKDTYF